MDGVSYLILMKKYIVLVLCVICILSGCSNDWSSMNASGGEPNGSTTDTEMADAMSTSYDFDGATPTSEFDDDEASKSEGVITIYGGQMKLGDYKGLDLVKEITVITDEYVENQIAGVLRNYSDYYEADVVQNDDFVTYESEVYCNDTLMEDYSGDNCTINVGDRGLGKEVDEKFIGLKVGDAADFEVTYPDDFENDSNLAGKTIKYQIKIKKIERYNECELNDEFVQTYFGDYANNVNDFKAWVRGILEEDSENTAKSNLAEKAIEYARNTCKFISFSKDKYKERFDIINNNYLSYSDFLGYSSLEEAYAFFDSSQEEVAQSAFHQLCDAMTVYAIAYENGFAVTDEEVAEEQTAYMLNYGYDSISDLEKDYSEDSIRYMLLYDKVCSYIIENANITTKEVFPEAE